MLQDLITLKARLHQHCLMLIDQRINTARAAMDAATAAAQEETKSSAGDKYETGRAMMQQESEKNKVQLLRAMQLRNELTSLQPTKICWQAEAGALIQTNHGAFYLAVGLGKVNLDKQICFVVSPKAPLGQALLGGKAGEEVRFQDRVYEIEGVV